MFFVEVHEYDYFTGNKYTSFGPYVDHDEAVGKYNSEKSRDFDYDDHYRETTMIGT